MAIEIRPSRATDLEHLRDLYLVTRQAAFPWVVPENLQRDDFDRDTQDEPILMAVVDGSLTGFVSWWPPENFIHNLFVAPEFQGRGIGQSLLAAALTQIGRPATLKCVQQNEPAIQFYRRLGWEIAGEGATDGVGYFLMSLSNDEAT